MRAAGEGAEQGPEPPPARPLHRKRKWLGSVPRARGSPGLGGGSEEAAPEAEVKAAGEEPPEAEESRGGRSALLGEECAPWRAGCPGWQRREEGTPWTGM